MKRKGKSPKESTKALGYMRTSSASNVGNVKDSEKRQSDAIQGFADRNGIEIVEWFYDPAVSGADALESRPGFAAMLERIAGNGMHTVVVENTTRFARDLMVQEVGYARLKDEGIDLIATDSPQSFVDDTPTAVLVRQVLGAIAQFDKAATVAKLKGARDRKSRLAGKRIEGRRSLSETSPDAVLMAKRLYRANPKTGERRPSSPDRCGTGQGRPLERTRQGVQSQECQSND